MNTHPSDFYKLFVKRAYVEWCVSPHDEYLAKVATHQANVMAERVWNFFKDTDLQKVMNAKTVNEYRQALVKKCADFQLVWDVDDGHKHVRLDRKSRLVTNAHQTGTKKLGWGEGGFGEGTFGGSDQIVITQDDGRHRPLSALLKNVMTMWDSIVAQM